MVKIAVYDRLYGKKDARDVVGEALKDSSHEVIARAYRLREAVGQILQFKDAYSHERPDIFIMGPVLDDEEDYKRDPMVLTEPCTISKRTWYGTKKVEAIRTTYMLPQYKHGSHTYCFPSVTSAHPRVPHEATRQWQSMRIGLAAPLLSRMVETYLPEAVRIGVSNEHMYEAVLHQNILRGHDDAVQQIQGHLRYYGTIADTNRGQ